MEKAIISDRIYFKLPSDKRLVDFIIESLTYKIIRQGAAANLGVEYMKTYKRLPNNILSIPQGRQDLIPPGHTIIDKRIEVPVTFPKPSYELYPEQQEIYEKVDSSAIINALVAWGKSFTALYLAKKFGQKTLVITHTTALRDQWVEETENLFGFTPSIIGGGKIDTSQIITIGNIQTLRTRVPTLCKAFGTVIVDEMHHVPSSTFSETLDRFHAKYRLGLSGTLKRKDGKHIVITDYFGDKVFIPPATNALIPSVLLVNTGIGTTPGAAWVDRITGLIRNDNYVKLVHDIAVIHVEKGYQVLVIADRLEFINKLGELLGDDFVVVTGETNNRAEAKEQLLLGNKKGVVGARQIFSEGLSVNTLSAVILAVPINNDSLLEQIIGRIQRRAPNKRDPLVIDLQLAGVSDRVQNRSRKSFYLRKGWKIKEI